MRSDNRDIRHMIYSQPEVWKLLTLDYILLTLLHLGLGGQEIFDTLGDSGNAFIEALP